MPYPRVAVRPGGNGRTLAVHPATARMHGLDRSDVGKVYVRCASRRTAVYVDLDDRVRPGVWRLSPDALADLQLTDPVVPTLRFRVKWEGSAEPTLAIGPVIGIWAGETREQLGRNRFRHALLDLVWNVERTGGLVYFFASDDIDWERRSIRGFLHVPDKVKWEEATFPYPDALYRRCATSHRLLLRMTQEITPNLFNAPASDKWGQAEALRSGAGLAAYVPDTRPLDTEDALVRMLDRYGAVYVKHTLGGAGRGVFRVEKFRGGFSVQSRGDGGGGGGRKPREVNAWAGGFDALVDYITVKSERPFWTGRWVVQQAISLARFDGRRVDFRTTVQKDGLGRWQLRSTRARLAPTEGAAITPPRPTVSAGVVLRTLFPGTWRLLEAELVHLAAQVCERLERSFGLLGDVAVDFGLDPWGNVWLFDANPGPAYRPDDRPGGTYWRDVAGPVRYASYLCGFGLGGP